MTVWLALVLAASGPAAEGTGAFERVAADVARQVTGQGFEAPVGVYVEGLTAPAARAFATLVMGKLAGEHKAPLSVDARSASDAEAVARSHGARSLVRLTLALEGTRLVARGDGLSTWVNFWAGQTPTRAGPATALVAASDADLEALTLAGGNAPPTSMELKAAVLTRLPGPPAALALGDLDGDRKAEVVVLVNEEVLVFSADGRALGRYDLSAAPLAARPTREPFGALAVLASPPRVVAWSARRARPEVLLWKDGLRAQGVSDEVPLNPSVRLDPGFNRFAAEVSFGKTKVALGAPAQAIGTRGGVTLALFSDNSGALFRGSPSPARFSGVGVGSVLVDVDGDGVPEVLASTPRLLGDTDELRLFSLGSLESVQARGGTLGEASTLWQGPMRGRAIVAASGELDGEPGDEAVVGSWLSDGTGELLLLRRAP
jgi:hypothetical protein